jgi:hypothetical protein
MVRFVRLGAQEASQPAPRRMFVEALLVEASEPAEERVEGRYDEKRSLTLTALGEPLVTSATAGETTTLTEVRNEHED